MRNHTRSLDHHRRSHYDTIRIGPKGKFNWVSTVEQQPHGKVVLQSRGEVAALSQPTQPKPNPITDRLGQPDRCVERSGQPDGSHSVSVAQRETSRSLEIEGKGFHERFFESERSGRPDGVSDNSKEFLLKLKRRRILTSIFQDYHILP